MSNVGENRTDDTNIENEVRLQQLAGVPVVDNDVDRAQEPLGYKKDEAGSSASGSDGTVKIEDEIPVEKPAVPDIGPPPDGGLTAWMQVLSNFLIHFLGGGTRRKPWSVRFLSVSLFLMICSIALNPSIGRLCGISVTDAAWQPL